MATTLLRLCACTLLLLLPPAFSRPNVKPPGSVPVIYSDKVIYDSTSLTIKDHSTLDGKLPSLSQGPTNQQSSSQFNSQNPAEDFQAPISVPSDYSPDDRINLHHSLKEAHHSVLNAIKNVGGYVHQRFSTVAKKGIDTVSRPFISLLGPVIYFKDQLQYLSGVNRSSQEQDISSWCSTCLEEDHSSAQTPNGPDYYLSLSASTVRPANQDDIPVPPHSAGTETPTNPDFVFPSEFEKGLNGKNQNDVAKDDSGIDIRFGNYQEQPVVNKVTEEEEEKMDNENYNHKPRVQINSNMHSMFHLAIE